MGEENENSLLPDLVRLKLPWIANSSEVIILFSMLRSVKDLDALNLTAEEGEELERVLLKGHMTSENLHPGCYVIWEASYRVFRDLYITEMLW